MHFHLPAHLPFWGKVILQSVQPDDGREKHRCVFHVCAETELLFLFNFSVTDLAAEEDVTFPFYPFYLEGYATFKRIIIIIFSVHFIQLYSLSNDLS